MKKRLLFLVLPSVFFASDATYDLGLGTIFINYPSYIGSKTNEQLITPFPYINYQDDKVTINRGDVEYKLFNLNELTLDVSLGGSFPSDSQESEARRGMEDLDLTFEIGPRIKYQLYSDDKHKFFLRFPIRVLFSTDFPKAQYEGLIFSPDFHYKHNHNQLETKFSTGPVWGNKTYHRYFYGVEARYATSSRPEYHTKAGYGGYRSSLSLKYQHNSWVYGGFIAHYNLQGATFESSPLVETDNSFVTGTYISYTFWTH